MGKTTIFPPMQHVPDEVVFGGAQSDPAERLYNAEQMAAAIARARRAGAAEERERCAKVAETYSDNDNFTANIRTMPDEPELVRDRDGSWVFRPAVASAIRALPDGD